MKLEFGGGAMSSKLLQDLRIDVALLSETSQTYDSFVIPNYHFYRTNRCPGRKCETVIAVRKGIPYSHAELPPLVLTEVIGVCIPIGNSEDLLAAIYKFPGHACNDTESLSS
jgi:hypothetical protein